jgi:tetratricopeptide (TPR) repeat protein
MPESTLRAYLKEIDDLIEHEQLDEAIAHSRHILQTYPKHLDTYRLLGKAYLEAKRYGDAADIFQRVLSAIPDDFVAHVGMAIVREDEGNTEAAIWHMERAFETNPANPAIQQELRRLIGRRDGIEPHKIRLTRGALARMYAHGELYPQAVAELRGALQEDPDRSDLQVVLADMYWRTGQRAEAVELCNQILERLPFCREANRILAAGLQAAGRNDEAAAYHRRLAMLDPYAGFISAGTADPQTVAAESVRIEKLSWAPGQALPAGQPEWASSLGVDLRATQPASQEPPPAPVPYWLESLEAQKGPPAGVPASEEPPTAPFAEVPEEAKSEIPSWMRQAGWQEASGETVETHLAFSEEEIATLDTGGPPIEAAAPPPEAELAPGQIPEWLQAAAPKAAAPAAPAAVPAEEAALAETAGDALPEWIDEITPQPLTPEGEAAPADEQSLWPPLESAAEPEPLSLEAEPSARSGWAESAPPAEMGIEGLGPGELPTWLEEPSPGATDTIITWLGDRAGREPEAGETTPPWLGETAAPDAEPDMAAAIESEPEAFRGAPPVDALSEDFISERTPGWLSGVADAAAQQEPLKPDEVARLRERGETVQASAEGEDWLEGNEEPEAGEPASAAEAPDWLRGLKSIEPSEPSEPAPGEEVPKWLREPSQVEAAGAPPGQEPPDWLSRMAGTEPVEEPESAVPAEALGELAGVTQPPKPAPTPVEEAPDWLEGLAVSELGETVGPSAAEAGGDWLRAMAETEEAGVAAQGPRPTEKPGAPDWMRDLGEAAALVPGEPVPSFEAPVTEGAGAPEFEGEIEWLPEMPDETAAGAMEEAPPSEAGAMAGIGLAAARLDEDDVLQWLESLAAEQEGAEAPAATIGEGAGPGLPPVVEEAAPILEGTKLPEVPVEGLEWLERLTEERGIEAGPEAGISEAGEVVEGTPEWLLETTPMEAGPQAPVPAPEVGEEIPEWLRFADETKPVEAESLLPAAPEPALEAAQWPFGKEAEAPFEGVVEAAAEPEAFAPTPEPEPIGETGFETAQWLREFEAGEPEMGYVPPEEAVVPAVEAPPIPEEVPAAAGVQGRAATGEEVVLLLPGDEALRALEAELEQSFPEWLRRSGEPMAALEAEEPPRPRLEVQPARDVRGMPAEPPAAVVAPTAEPVAPPTPAFEAAPPAPPLEVPAPAPEPVAPPTPIFEAAPPAPEILAEPVVAMPPVAPPSPPPPTLAPERAAPAPVEVPPFEIEAAPRAHIPPAEVVLPTPPVIAPPAPAVEAAPAAPPAPTEAVVPPPAAVPAPLAPVVTPARPPEAPAPEPSFVAPPRPAVEAPMPAPVPTPPAERPMIVTPPPAPTVAWPVAVAPAPAPAEAVPMPEAAPVVAPRVAPPKPAPPSPAEVLEAARGAMTAGDIQTALGRYATLIRKKRELETVIEDLRSALGRGSALPEVWQALGDAYMKADRLPEAIEAYRRGLESV